MKAVIATFNQEKALVGALSVIVKTGCGTDGALHSTSYILVWTMNREQLTPATMSPACTGLVMFSKLSCATINHPLTCQVTSPLPADTQNFNPNFLFSSPLRRLWAEYCAINSIYTTDISRYLRSNQSNQRVPIFHSWDSTECGSFGGSKFQYI